MNQDNQSDREVFILLKDCNGTIESYFICGLLDSVGIEYEVETKGITPIMGDLEEPIPSVKIFVSKKDAPNSKKLLVKEKEDHDDIEFHAYKNEINRKGRIWGRVVSILASIFFGSFLFFPIHESYKEMRYIFISISVLFLLFFAFQFDWKKKNSL